MDEAIRLTKQTIEARSARFRKLVVGVVGLVATCFVSALAFLSWKPLVGLLLLVPLVCMFIWRDAASVNQWRRGIIDLWVSGGLDIDVFSMAVRGMPIFPLRTLDGMLAALPTRENGITLAALSPRLRKALAGTLEAVGRFQGDRMALATLTYTIGLFCLAVALLRQSWMPLVGLLLIMPIQVAGRGIAILRFRRRWRWVRELLPEDDERKALVETAGRLDWEPVPAAMKQRLLRSVRSGERG